MAGTAVTNEWVTTMFGDSLKNGLYIIFRVEGHDIKDGFILKHYGVNVTGDKLDLDNHRIVKSTKLENEKIDSTMLNLGIKDGCNLSGMGFVKKDDRIRPFVDVTDGTGTDTKTIRKRLDNESTINNFFNHNIYDWFIKKKIRDHIRDAHGESDEDDDVGKCLNLISLKDQQNNLQVLNTLLNKYNNNPNIHNVIVNFIKSNPYLLSEVNKAFDNHFVMPLVDTLKFLSSSSSDDLVSRHMISTLDNKIIPLIKNDIKNSNSTIISDTQKDTLVNLESATHTLQPETQYNIETVEAKTKSISKREINFYGNERDNTLIQTITVDNSTMPYIYKLNEIPIINPNHQGIENNIKKITNFLKGSIRFFLSLPLNDSKSIEFWTELYNKLQGKSISPKDSLYFLFVNCNFLNDELRDLVEADTTKYEGINNMVKILEDGLGPVKIQSRTRYYYPYEINKHNNIFMFLYKIIFSTHDVETKIEGRNKTLTEIYNEINFIHIADLIQIYYTMKTEIPKRDNELQEYVYQFDTITKTLENYFFDLSKETQNTWWKNLDEIENVAKDIATRKNFSKEFNIFNDQKIMSFVKVNNYTNIDGKYDLNKWNLTYQPYISSQKQFLKLKVQNYSDTLKEKNFYFPEKKISQTYIFGGFSKVFYPNTQPDRKSDKLKNEIDEMINASQTTTIVNKIIGDTGKECNEKVFIFGYGASGAGKTAMLVYNNKTNTDGYCIRVCKEIAKKLKTETKTNDVIISINIKEKFYSDGKKKNDDYFKKVDLKYSPSNPDEFQDDEDGQDTETYINDAYKIYTDNENYDNTTKQDIIAYMDQLCAKDEFSHEYSLSGSGGTIKIPLSFILRKYVTDESQYGKRKIESTRNNDQSSRSHVLVYIDFKVVPRGEGEIKKGSLIIADLAGVENPFDPNDSDTIVHTMNKNKKKNYEDGFKIEDCDKNFQKVLENKIKLKGNIKLLKNKLLELYNPGHANPDSTNGYYPPIDDDGYLKMMNLEKNNDSWKMNYNLLKGDSSVSTFTISNNVDENFINMLYYPIKDDKYNGWWKNSKVIRKHTSDVNELKKKIKNKNIDISNTIENINEHAKKSESKHREQNEERRKWLKFVKSKHQYTYDRAVTNDIIDDEDHHYVNKETGNKLVFRTDKGKYDNFLVDKYKVDGHYYPRYAHINPGTHQELAPDEISFPNGSNSNWTSQDEYKFYIWRKKNFELNAELNILRSQRDKLKSIFKTESEDTGSKQTLTDGIYGNFGGYIRYMEGFKSAIKWHKVDPNVEKLEAIYYRLLTSGYDFTLNLENISIPTGTPRLEVGTKVTANYKDRGKYYPGKITNDNGNGTFGIDYDDGYKENNVKLNNIRIDNDNDNNDNNDNNDIKTIIKNYILKIHTPILYKSIDQINDSINLKLTNNSSVTLIITSNQELNSKVRSDKLSTFINNFRTNNTNTLLKYKNDSIESALNVQYNESDIKDFETNFKNSLQTKLKYEDKYNTEEIKKIEENARSHLLFIMNEVFIRKKEGDYINKQLELLRINMFSSMYQKTDGVLFTAPTIDPTCSSSICSDDKLYNCFMMKCKKANSAKAYTDIFLDIKKTYYNTGSKLTDKQAMNEVIKSLNILIFTVFNISEKNTPIKAVNNPFYPNDPTNMLTAFSENTQYIDLDKIYTELYDTSDSNKTYTNEIIQMFKNSNTAHVSISQGSIQNELEELYQGNYYADFLEKLNTHNASTPLGTLIFTDNISKFGLDNICHNDSIINSKDEYNFAIEDRRATVTPGSNVIEMVRGLDFKKETGHNLDNISAQSEITKKQDDKLESDMDEAGGD